MKGVLHAHSAAGSTQACAHPNACLRAACGEVGLVVDRGRVVVATAHELPEALAERTRAEVLPSLKAVPSRLEPRPMWHVF